MRAYGRVGALAGVNVTVEPGHIVALLGPSGAGKTTLLRLLLDVESPDGGQVLVNGAPLARRGPARRAFLRRTGWVQQRPGLLSRSVVDNVAFPLRAAGVPRPEAQERALEPLEKLGLGGRATAHASELSGGEAQRVALARALAHDPALIVLDEFTNQMDPQAEEAAETLVLDAKRRGAAVIAVTHHVSQARRLADHVLFLVEGRAEESGPAAQVLDRPRSAFVQAFFARAA